MSFDELLEELLADADEEEVEEAMEDDDDELDLGLQLPSDEQSLLPYEPELDEELDFDELLEPQSEPLQPELDEDDDELLQPLLPQSEDDVVDVAAAVDVDV